MDIKENFYGKLQQIREGAEQLDEISYKKAKEAEHKAAGKYYDAYDNEKDARKKAIKDKTPESKKEAEDAGEKRNKSAKRVIRFQKYADKKKLEEEQIDELSDPTHMSYRAKARNQMDKMVNRLGSKMGSDTVNTKKLKNRADGIKRSYKLQPKKKMNEEEQLDELKKSTLASYIKKASHDVATKSAATGRYADRANRARDEMKKGDYKNWSQGKKDDEFADKMFKKSWNRRKGIAKAADKLAK